MTGGSDATEYPHAFTQVFDLGCRSYPNASPTARAMSVLRPHAEAQVLDVAKSTLDATALAASNPWVARCCWQPGTRPASSLCPARIARCRSGGVRRSPRHRAKSRRRHARPGEGSARLADRSCPPIKLAQLVSLPPYRRVQPGSDTDPSASAPDRHRRTADCKKAAAPPAGTFRRSDSRVSLARAQPSLASIVQADAGRLGSERNIKARPARRARSANASASP